MGYNISEVGGGSTGSGTAGVDVWTFNADLSDTGLTVVSGDFSEAPVGGGPQTEAPDGYSFSALSTGAWGSLTFNTADGTFSFTIDRAAVLASGTDQTVTFTVTGFDGGTSDTDTVIINILVCVVRGTRIQTESGERAVEDLRIGDRVWTLDSGFQPVRWVGVRRVGAGELALHPNLRPVRIRQGALSDGDPECDLLVSPQHRVLLRDWRAALYFGAEEVLVPAKGLLNDHSVVIDHDIDEVEYFHILFDSHQIIRTNGALTESFYPGPASLAELRPEARAELLTLFPDLAEGTGRYGPAARPSLRVFEADLLGESPRKVRLG